MISRIKLSENTNLPNEIMPNCKVNRVKCEIGISWFCQLQVDVGAEFFDQEPDGLQVAFDNRLTQNRFGWSSFDVGILMRAKSLTVDAP